jgi:hypothetical protein
MSASSPAARLQDYLKTGLTGTYHAFKFAKYAHRCLAEFQYRFNRRFDLRSPARPAVKS